MAVKLEILSQRQNKLINFALINSPGAVKHQMPTLINIFNCLSADWQRVAHISIKFFNRQKLEIRWTSRLHIDQII